MMTLSFLILDVIATYDATLKKTPIEKDREMKQNKSHMGIHRWR